MNYLAQTIDGFQIIVWNVDGFCLLLFSECKVITFKAMELPIAMNVSGSDDFGASFVISAKTYSMKKIHQQLVSEEAFHLSCEDLNCDYYSLQFDVGSRLFGQIPTCRFLSLTIQSEWCFRTYYYLYLGWAQFTICDYLSAM